MNQAPREYGHGWQGTWENMGRYLENVSPPVVWNFTPEQLQDPDEVMECLKKRRSGYSKVAQLATLCWALASIYQTLLDIMQHPQGEERENIPTDTMAKPDTISVASITKKKQWKQKSACLVKDEEASPKRKREKESEEAVCSAAGQSQEWEEEETEIINEIEAT
ncbi:ubiquitin carboxyl-terminal hydrolase 4 [Limosa lapponica baueri]|uniref:Ubiquitin carboxyl-terminal hydrolase 4 n=1 Tax=Limosa lapponica baueri TaxID=1758121 RepID=A0A2I0TMH7_LIMLA|nr:ubiquitin carboxyl-terminal hydrolase 4 [Limosa lapponica baueri]